MIFGRATRALMVPEVVQTSAMDCGPAALKALLEGHGIAVSYGRLREACQTQLDGTSIDTIEEVAKHFGLDADQVMVPVDHLLLPEARCLPAMVVVQLPAGDTHFVIVWRRHGGVVQVMDPATGRRWPSVRRFLAQVYVHEHQVDAVAWREWAGSDDFLRPLGRQLADCGVAGAEAERLVAAASADPGWQGLARVDAAVRAVAALIDAGAVRRGAEALRTIEALRQRATDDSAADAEPAAIPRHYWSVRRSPDGDDTSADAMLLLRGAVLLRVRGRRTHEGDTLDIPELVAAAAESPARPLRALLDLVRGEGLGVPAATLLGMAAAAAAVVVEAVLLRGLFSLGRELGLVGQRVTAIGALAVFAAAILLLELGTASVVLRLGRRLEVRLRIAFLDKLSRLGDRYFQSRPVSDMAERSHSVHRVRQLPALAGQLARATLEVVFTTIGLVWLAPRLAPLAIVAGAVAVGVPLLAQPWLIEQDLRVRTHAGGLSRFYLDALLGLVAVRAHGAESAVRREHEGLLVDWARASLGLARTVTVVDGVHSAVSFALAASLLLAYVHGGGEPAGILLLVYWALNLPVLGQDVASVCWQYPALRNVTLRLLEPLGALDDATGSGTSGSRVADPPCDGRRGVAIRFDGVHVRAAGHEILRAVTLAIAPGTQVAIVGASGAGKSSLVGLLLGWHQAAAGAVLVDEAPLDGVRLERLRGETAWVDPAVQLWNRSLLDNLCYGASASERRAVGDVVGAADLRGIIERLPDGMQTPLGESGALISGGEGQRVRLGRAMLRADARLVILDEPFRGLDRTRRAALLTRARGWWPQATLLCITHDVGETIGFERVLVVEGGAVVEDGRPSDLAAQADSRYRALLNAEQEVRSGLWASALWRHVRLVGGRLVEEQRRDGSSGTIPRPIRSETAT